MRKEIADLPILAGFLLILAGTIAFVRPFAIRTCEEIYGLRFTRSIIIPLEDKNKLYSMKEAADAYNEAIAARQEVQGFHYTDTYEDAAYDALPGAPHGIICVVEIPKLHLLLPVGHGTSAELLRAYAGHLYGTSLPTGGSSTHAVIAAHAGLTDRELFTYLPTLHEGDVFHIYVLGEKHTYMVDRITEVSPSETDLLCIIQGEDHVTLMTCVPYGINTRRLFVRGGRMEAGEQTGTDDIAKMYNGMLRRLILRLAALVLVPAAEILIFTINMQNVPRQHKRRAKTQLSE